MDDEQEIDDEELADRAAAEALGAVAVLQIRYASGMTDAGRREIAEWLHRQADSLIGEGGDYAALFTAKYNPED